MAQGIHQPKTLREFESNSPLAKDNELNRIMEDLDSSSNLLLEELNYLLSKLQPFLADEYPEPSSPATGVIGASFSVGRDIQGNTERIKYCIDMINNIKSRLPV